MKKQSRPGPGSHNRHTSKVIAHHERSRNLFAECKCIIHRNTKGKGTQLEKTAFNRQGDGTQSMCREGKTLIDAIKHKFWRIANVIPLAAIIENTPSPQNWETLKADPMLQSKPSKEAFKRIEASDEFINFSKSLKKGSTGLQEALRLGMIIESELTLKSLGLYGRFDSALEAKTEFEEFNARLHSLTPAELMQDFEDLLDTLIEDEDTNYFVRESSEQLEWNALLDVGTNWSKRNDVYVETEDGMARAHFRGPFHNTLRKGAASESRMVKYLVEIDRNRGPREVGRWIAENRQVGYHADHIMPLALGGRHTQKNLVMLPSGQNLNKKDRLTFEAFKLMTSDMSGIVGMVNKDALPIVIDTFEEIGHNKEKFEKEGILLTAKLREAMTYRRDTFAGMSAHQKKAMLKKIRPDLNDSQISDFIARFDRASKAK